MDKIKIFDKILNSKLYLMLFSVIIAFIFWFVIVATVSPDSTRTISGIPVTVNENSGFISSAGLHVIEESSPKISVDVTGPRYLIGALTASDFIITPDVAKVTKSGKYSLRLDASLKKPNSKVSIVKVSPASAEFKFDTIVSKSLTVEVKVLNNSKVADGYVMEAASVSPKQVAVTGPYDEVSQVSRAVASIQVDSSAKATVTSKSAVVLFDSKNNQLDLKNIKIDNPTVTVTMPILKTKQAQLSVDYFNLPAGFDKSNIKCTITPKDLTVAGEESFINSLTTVKLDSIDFSTLDITNTLNDNITMPNGVINVDNITSASLSISLQNTSTKTLSTKDFKVINIPSGYSVKVRTTQLDNIKLFGPSSDIGNVSSVMATVDMSSVNIVEGTYQVPVTISVSSKTGYWVTSKYYVTINSWKD